MDQEQLRQFYATFLDPHAKGPSHQDAIGASLPRIEQFEHPEMTEAQRAFLDEFKEICRTMDQAPAPRAPADLDGRHVDYRHELNESQLQAAAWGEGPLLVIAGAGTGKTRTICYRTAYLIEQGVSPGSILLLTFTRRAAEEMITRTAELLEDAKTAGKVHGGTFHAFAHHLLRRYAQMIGIDRNFTILDGVDAQDVISLIRDELRVKRRKEAPVPQSTHIGAAISRSRSCEIPLEEIVRSEYEQMVPYLEEILAIKQVFRDYKRVHRQLDYDDLLEVLHDSLIGYPEFRRKVQNRYQYIIVDEYQDTNLMQGRLVKALAGDNPQVMVVGDDAQSIYSFRGARHENILRFPHQFPGCAILRIEQNYRSGAGLLAYTNGIIRSMVFGYPKRLTAVDSRTVKPEVHRLFSQQEEASWVCSRLEALRETGIPLNQMAVLFRSQYLSTHLQAELLKRGIPFDVYGGLKFIERRHVKDMLAFLRIALNSLDGAAWNRVLRLLPDIGPAKAGLIIKNIMQNGGVFSSSVFSSYHVYDLLKQLEQLLEVLRNDHMALYERIMAVKQYYLPLLRLACPDAAQRVPDLDVLASLGAEGGSLEDFLSQLALDPPGQTFQEPRYGEEKQEEERLVLSTIHSAKGLEWRHVCIISLLDGVFPDSRAVVDLQQLEEERRLFYVACTRAQEGLYMTYPSYMQSYSKYFSLPSRFICEADIGDYRFFIQDREEPVRYV